MAEAFLDRLVRTTPSAEVRTGLAAVARAKLVANDFLLQSTEGNAKIFNYWIARKLAVGGVQTSLGHQRYR
jgi:hypothetical protein